MGKRHFSKSKSLINYYCSHFCFAHYLMKRHLFIFCLSFIGLSACSKNISLNIAESSRSLLNSDIDGEEWAKDYAPQSKLRGWEYLATKLNKQNVPLEIIENILSDKEMPLWTPIPFKVRPQESKAIYQRINTLAAQKNALGFYNQHRRYFKAAEQRFGVDKEIILAILQIETQCGKNTGNEPIFYWLSRLVSAGFPPNIRYNVKESKEEPKPTYRELEERAEWLEEEFMPHLLSLINTSNELQVKPISITGSKGGAIGLPQFLPGNIKKFGVDGDLNGVINLFTPADAIFSVGNFLKSHGWNKGLSVKEKKKVILEYNRSTAYAETVLNMASDLKKRIR